MNDKLFKKIAEKWQTIMILVFMIVAIVFSVSVFIPARYSSQIKMIIIQNHQSEEVDAFSAAKSAEYLSDIISNIVFTESFIQDMLDAPFEVKQNFSYSSEKRMKVWEKAVDVDKENNTGILTITTFDRSRDEVEKIAESIAWGLNVRGSKYHGGGNSVAIKTIDGPITSEKPATPNILLNSLLALIVGIIGAISIVNFFDDFELVLFSKNASGRKNGFKKQKASIKKILTSLEKIRKDLKPTSLVAEDYSIEELEKPTEILAAEKEESSKFENNFSTEELVKEIQPDKMQSSIDQGEVPENLPVFQDEKETVVQDDEKKTENGFITMEELNQEAEKMGLTDNKKEKDSKYEASSEDVKERLNKLLRGEL